MLGSYAYWGTPPGPPYACGGYWGALGGWPLYALPPFDWFYRISGGLAPAAGRDRWFVFNQISMIKRKTENESLLSDVNRGGEEVVQRPKPSPTRAATLRPQCSEPSL